MPSHVQENAGELDAVLTIGVTAAEATEKFNAAFRKYSNNTEIKGFRKGKAPLSYLKKTAGPSLLYNTVTEMALKELDEFVKNHKVLGNPVMDMTTPKYDFDPDAITDYSFKFLVALEPEIELQGLDKSTVFTQYRIRLTEEELDKYWSRFADRFKKSVEIDSEPIQEKDILVLHLEECQDGALRENGVSSDFTVAFDDMTDTAQSAVLGQSKGFSFDSLIDQIEKNTSPEDIREYILNDKTLDLDQINPTFRATVTGIRRMVGDEIDQHWFDTAFGPGKVSSLEEAREEIRMAAQKELNSQCDDLLIHDIRNWFLEAHPFPLPVNALRKWIDQEESEDNKPPVDDQTFAGNLLAIRWQLLSAQVAKTLGIEIKREDFLAYFRSKYMHLGVGDQFAETLTDMALKETKMRMEAQNDIFNAKLIEAGSHIFQMTTREVTVREFQAIVDDRFPQHPAASVGDVAIEEV